MNIKVKRSKVVIRIIFTIIALSVLSVILIPMGFIYLLNNGNPYTQYILNKKLPPYLEQRGYSDEDIIKQQAIDPKNTINKDYYHARYQVIFKDEPDVTYYYGIKKRGKSIDQFCEKDVLVKGVETTNREQTKFSEDKCISMYANK